MYDPVNDGVTRRMILELVTVDLTHFWIVRASEVNAPNVRLVDLVRLDERIDACFDALLVGRGTHWSTIFLARTASEALPEGAVFIGTSLAILSNSGYHFDIALEHAASSSSSRSLAELISALARLNQVHALDTLEQMHRRSEPGVLAASVAMYGARRSDVGSALFPFLADPSPLVRARAYRTTGQLGRADLMAQLRPGLTDPDPECRFWSAWAAARMGATEPLDTLADIAWNNLPRADRALDLLLRRLDVPQANAWLREFAKVPDRQRSLIRATGVIGDPLYIPWLIERMADPDTARLAGESFSMITGLDLAYRDLDRRPPADFQSGPNDDPADENVALDEDENLPWPDPERIGQWWTANRSRFSAGTPYFLGAPKATADWLEALSDAFQRQRHAAALELAIRQPNKAMFEVRARGRLQRQLLARARGSA
jgi:uncharacterized protein (TIGR02270 family)